MTAGIITEVWPSAQMLIMVIQLLALLASVFSFISIFPQIIAMLKSEKMTVFPLHLKVLYFIIPLSWLIWSIKEESYLPLFASLLNLILASFYLFKVSFNWRLICTLSFLLVAGLSLYFIPVVLQEAITATLSILMVLVAIREIDRVEDDISSLKYFLEGVEELVWCGWAFLSAVPLIGISSLLYGTILLVFSYKIQKKSESMGYFNRLISLYHHFKVRYDFKGIRFGGSEFSLSGHNLKCRIIIHNDLFFYIED